MNNKGMVYTLFIAVIAIFLWLVLYVVLDNALKEEVIPLAEDLGGTNTTRDNLVTAWDSSPFVAIGSIFVLLFLTATLEYAFTRGR